MSSMALTFCTICELARKRELAFTPSCRVATHIEHGVSCVSSPRLTVCLSMLGLWQHLQEMCQRLTPSDKLADLRQENSPQLHGNMQTCPVTRA